MLKEYSSQINDVEFFRHFIAFLDYLKDNKAKLTQNKNLSLKVIDQISQFIPKPSHFTEEWPLHTEAEWWYLELIDILAQLMRLAANRKGHRVLTKNGREYLHKPLADQYYRLFLAYWGSLNWAYLFNCADDQPAEVLQAARERAVRTMLEFKKDQAGFIDWHDFAEFLRLGLELKIINYRNEELPDRARDCVRDVLIEPLALFGLLELKEEKGEYGIKKLMSFKLTGLGREILGGVVGQDMDFDFLPVYKGDPGLN